MSTRKPKADTAAQPPESAAELAPEIVPPATEPTAELAPEIDAIAVTEGAEALEDGAAVTEGPAAAPEPAHYLVAACRPRGRWRAGRFWTPEPIRVARDEFDDEAWALLQADPVLTVTPEA